MKLTKRFKEFNETNLITIEGNFISYIETVNEIGNMKAHISEMVGFKVFYLNEIKSINYKVLKSRGKETEVVIVNESDYIECSEKEFFEFKTLLEEYWIWNAESYSESEADDEETV